MAKTLGDMPAHHRPTRLHVISSMATRHLLAERIDAFRAATGAEVVLTAIGGVDAARRVRAGEAFDIVVLAADALKALRAEGQLADEPDLAWVDSGVAVAVPAGAPLPDLSTEAAVRDAALGAALVGVSTGPSGVALKGLLSRWGVEPARVVQAPAGVPVATLLARREVDLGFQQLSELIGCEGIAVAGPLPPPIQVTTTFSAAVAATAGDVPAALEFLRCLADPSSFDTFCRHGMTPHLQEASR